MQGKKNKSVSSTIEKTLKNILSELIYENWTQSHTKGMTNQGNSFLQAQVFRALKVFRDYVILLLYFKDM